MCMDYKNIKVEFIAFSAFGRFSMEIDGFRFTLNVKSQQYLQAQLDDFIGYILFTAKKRCKGLKCETFL